MTPRTDIEDMTGARAIDHLSNQLRNIVADAEAERDRHGYIAATIRVNALRGGATTEETEAMVRGEVSFLDWLANRFARSAQVEDGSVARLVEAATHLLRNYLQDELDDPDLCVSDEHWTAIRDLDAALAAIDAPK